MELYPYRFVPVYKDYIWGGTRIGRTFARPGVGRCAESWEIAAREDGDTAIANGPCRGVPFRELLAELGHQITGQRPLPSGRPAASFPLLIKLIDAEQRLSLQVHPDERTAPATGGEPKTEMWYVLEAAPGARIFAGLRPGVTRESFRASLADKALEPILQSHPVSPGQAVFIPGGRVHAIGEGCLLLEIQQNSNTTWRVFDWDRRDSAGRTRELHVDQALACIDWNDGPVRLVTPRYARHRGINQRAAIVRSPFFSVSRLHLRRTLRVQPTGRSFHAYFVLAGTVTVESPGHREAVSRGESFLVPAAIRHFRLLPVDGDAHLIHITR